MSYAEYHSQENSLTPLINMFQLISLPIVSFAVITPLCMMSGQSVLASFVTGWGVGLLSMVMLITAVFALNSIQTSRASKLEEARRNVVPLRTYRETRQASVAIAEWDMDALLDRLDASYQNQCVRASA